MTPKEKAIELVGKFNNHTVKELIYLKNGKVIEGKTEAKQCALIAVDEMISYFQKETFMMAYPEIAISEVAYWQEVKKEIEAL
jgi:hypothetical protein